MKQAAQAQQVQLCSTMSGFPTVAKPSPTRRPPDARVFSAISSIKYSIAIDPIKYIRIPFSFYYFKPDSNVINNNRMPSKPSLPFNSIFGFHSHFVIPSFGSRMQRTEVAPCLGPSRPNYELDFQSFQPPDLTPRTCSIFRYCCGVIPAAPSARDRQRLVGAQHDKTRTTEQYRLALRDRQRSLWRIIPLCLDKRHGRCIAMQPKAFLLRGSQPVSKISWVCRDRWTQCRHHRKLRIIHAVVSLRGHAADDRQAE